MKIAFIQSSLEWENPAANRIHFEEYINEIDVPVDLIVLPEMFTSGFTMHPNLVAETMHGETILWMKQLSKEKNAAITASLVITEEGNFYNRLVFVFPSGDLQYYDKRHLFTLAGEDKMYTAGSQKIIIEYLGWKICPLVCYDLRFPVFARNVEDYDVLLYVANWPETRINAWDILLKARAVENMCYTIGVNRIGVDANNYVYNGHSQVQDFLGRDIIVPQNSDGIFIASLDKKSLLETRQKLGFLNDKDDFEIK